jgi:NAD dependent epimerase/dehydratase family
VLEGIIKKYPNFQITALLRLSSPEFMERYPQVKAVLGTFDDVSTIETASYEADIIVHAGNSDHEKCVSAILAGLARKTTPSYLIHLSGAGSIADITGQTWEGKVNPKIWSDIADIDEIYNLPEHIRHRKVDRAIADASNDLMKTVTIAPPNIFGQSTGIGSQETHLVPKYVKTVMRVKEVFYLGEGENRQTVVHIQDVVEMFLLLIAQALGGGGKADWGREVHPSEM